MVLRLLGVDWAPWDVPLERRLQTFSVMIHILAFTILPLICTAALLWLLTTPLWFVALGYVTWIVVDVNVLQTSRRGGRRIDWMRQCRLWSYLQQYFPVTLIKTADLDPERNYIFGCHPHGIIGYGVVSSFGTESAGFSTQFPGLTASPITLTTGFKVPFLRSYLLALGACDASKESIRYLLDESGQGRVVVLVIGGASEALEAKPGKYKLTLKTRKGFIKMALQSGAALVPVFSFGENDLYRQADNPRGSWVRNFQERCKKATGFSPPLFYGRGVFNYTFGLLPHRKPINTIVGAAIDVPKTPDPPAETVDEFHQKYMAALARLFDEHKADYGVDENTHLEFV